MMFDFCHSLHHLPVPLTGECLEQLLDAPWLHHLCEQIAAGDKSKKRELPAVTWQAHFNGQKRANTTAVSSGLYQLDVDHCHPDEVWERVAPRIEELGIYVVHKTASREGIRLVARCRQEFSTLLDNQLWLADQIGVQADTACKDFARLGFLCERSYFYYYNPAVFTDEATVLLPNPSADTQPVTLSSPKAPIAPSADLTFKGVPYQEIVSELITRTGGEPYEGERNNRLYLICRLLANITDRQVERLYQVCPRFGLSEAEVRACCESACKSSRTEKLPYVLYKVLRDLGIQSEVTFSKESEEELLTSSTASFSFPEVKHLPPLIREFVETSPDDFKAAAAMACLPVCGFLGSRLRAHYLDGDLQAPSFIVNIVAPAASGKGSLLRIPDICLEKIRQQDTIGREIEAEYNRQCKLKKNEKKQLEEPQCIIRDVPAKISVAQLLRRMVKAQGLHLISISPEADTLTNSNKAGIWAQKSDIYRIAQDADGGRYGQDYSSETSFSAVVQVRYNLLTLGTPGAIARAYPDVEDGLITRCIIVSLPSQFGKQMPTRVQLSSRQLRIIQERVDALMNISQDEQGNVQPEHYLQLAWLRNGMEQWIQEQRIRSVRDDDHARDQFMRRAALIGFRAGMLAAFLWGNCNKKRQGYTIEFAHWVAHFILESLLERYAQTVNEQALSYERPKSNRYPSLFDAMPDIFHLNNLRKACFSQGCKSPLKAIIFRWTDNGLIEKQGDHYVKLVK
jgi:hypothetical protein